MRFSPKAPAVQRAAGGELRHALLGLGARPLVAFGVGVLATAASQSSGATAAMLVGMVSAGLVPLAGAVGVLLGANVGSTLALGLLALQITDYACRRWATPSSASPLCCLGLGR